MGLRKVFDKQTIYWVLFLLVFSLSVRLWNLGAMGRLWDENSLLEKGYIISQLIQHGDFSNKFWYYDAADHPVFSFYFFGLASYGDLIRYDKNAPTVFSPGSKGAPIFHYDMTYGRMVSVIVSTIAVLLVFFFGKRYFSLFVGVVAAMILALLPHFLAYSQTIELESFIVLFFTAAVFSYYVFLETNQKKYLYLTGVLTGINLLVKQSNLIIIVLYIVSYFVYKKLQKKSKITFRHFIPLGVSAFIATFLLYPMPWFHLGVFLQRNYDIWLRNGGRIPELLFGIHMGAPFVYYIIAVLVTTPVLILLLTVIGMKVSFDNRRKWIYAGLVIWFFTPFLMSFFHSRQHMVRYIIEFYAPLALLSALGLEYLLTFIAKKAYQKYLYTSVLILYLFIILFRITPYYLTYFNELVGGPGTVYKHNLFFVGWWGEGLRDAGMYVASHAHDHARIGIAINPDNNVLYKKASLFYETFNLQKSYDYVIVNSFNVSRLGFDESVLKKKYKIVHTVNADGAEIVHVYKHI